MALPSETHLITYQPVIPALEPVLELALVDQGYSIMKFVFMVDYIDRFSHVQPSLHHLIMVDDLFAVFLDSVYEYLIEYICINVHEGNWSVILFVGSL
ncbi:putative disks large-like protein [Cricetulus griseus]|nr:putative disks large-like protein [Cricetulus griseus]